MARPRKFNEALAAETCQRIAEGSNLRKIAEDPAMPSLRTLLLWQASNPSFSHAYARAREVRADSRSDEIDRLVGEMLAGNIDPSVARVAIDALKWQAGKERPKYYGDRLATEITGAVEVSGPPRPSPQEVAAFASELTAAFAAAGGDAASAAGMIGEAIGDHALATHNPANRSASETGKMLAQIQAARRAL